MRNAGKFESSVWKWRKNIFLLILLFVSQTVFSQEKYSRALWLTGEDQAAFLDHYNTMYPSNALHTTIHHEPNYSYYTWANYYRKPSDTTKLVLSTKTTFLVRPLYDFSVGVDATSKRALYSTVGGIIISADYKTKFDFELRVAGGMTTLPNYLDSVARKSGMMPGWGDRAYPNGNGNYSFQHISGKVIWRPIRVFSMEVGRDKHFWGDGHRSLFLSDIGAAMPYMKLTTTIWKLQYTSLFTWMQDWTIANYHANKFQSKFGTFHYISFNAWRWLNIGVFESIIWQGNDRNRLRGFDVNYLNPIIFFRPVEFSLGSSDNSMLGFALKFRVNSNNQFYSQLVLDEFLLKEIEHWKQGWWGNKQGLQLGYKSFNLGKQHNMDFQLEYNIVRPYTYSHGSPQQNYANAGMPLAHPLGANFRELLGILSYHSGPLTIKGELVGARYGLDTAGYDYGQNIFTSYMNRSSTDTAHPNARDYGHHMFDGLSTKLFYAQVSASYRFDTKFPLRAEALIGIRNEHNTVIGNKRSFYLQVGLSLPLWKTYRDY